MDRVAAEAITGNGNIGACETLGELRSAIAAGLWKGGAPPELGAVVVGRAAARKHEDDVTICDLTGTGAQDTAIATYRCPASEVRDTLQHSPTRTSKARGTHQVYVSSAAFDLKFLEEIAASGANFNSTTLAKCKSARVGSIVAT